MSGNVVGEGGKRLSGEKNDLLRAHFPAGNLVAFNSARKKEGLGRGGLFDVDNLDGGKQQRYVNI